LNRILVNDTSTSGISMFENPSKASPANKNLTNTNLTHQQW
jgi:hypothetical protein